LECDAVARPVTTATAEQARLVRALTNPALYGPTCTEVRTLETHTSYVLLTGRHAYKIKKAVNLEFLDFTTLAARHFYCDRELELNRRLAPQIYLAVVPITGTADAPRIGGEGPVLEYAVKMVEFPQDALLTHVLVRGQLTAAHVETLAAQVAAFHASAAKAGPSMRAGSAAEILMLAVENFTEIEPLLEDEADRREADALRRWTTREHALRAPLFAERRRDGFVRDGHGDLHLGNIALIDEHITIFDCLEFNDDMRYGDVMADVAFLVMDLQDRGRSDFASRFLNAYLQLTGDYHGVAILRFYVVYRAMVRAKVACMRATQTNESEIRDAQINECREYLKLAGRSVESAAPAIVITRGPAGSGKTAQSQRLVELLGAIRIRTDVERKRLHGLPLQSRSGSALNAGLYSTAETERTYSETARLTRIVAGAGYPVVIDGTFLQRRQRTLFRALAATLNVPFVIVDFAAGVETLGTRVRKRLESGADPSEADIRVLEHQLQVAEPISSDERTVTVPYDAEAPLERSDAGAWRSVLERLTAHRRSVNTGHVA
jgi:uncharacterized protein